MIPTVAEKGRKPVEVRSEAGDLRAHLGYNPAWTLGAQTLFGRLLTTSAPVLHLSLCPGQYDFAAPPITN